MRIYFRRLSWVLSLVLWLVCSFVGGFVTAPSDYAALMSLYDTTGGLFWNWKNESMYGMVWNFSVLNANPCVQNWQGVTCNCSIISQQCNITQLSLPFYELKYRLPVTIGNLSSLVKLDLSNNMLTSHLPATIGQLTTLQVLSLGSNQFSGSIPWEWSSLLNLTTLSLTDNMLHGDLSILSQLSSIENVLLRQNNFSGLIYSSWSNLQNLKLLDLSDNSLSGLLPKNLSTWLENSSNLVMFDIGGNNLRGSIVQLLPNTTELIHLNISNNYFEGSLPCSTKWSKLHFYNAENNVLTGSLPNCISNLTELEYFNAANNQLEDSLLNFELLTNLQVLSLSRNRFSGHIKNAFSPSLVDLILDDNKLSSTIPADIVSLSPNLSTLSLQNNQFSGSIPPSLPLLSKLSVLFLNNNNLTGVITSVYHPQSQPMMQHIDLSGNRFRGSLPPNLFHSHSLLTFVASSNCFSGSIPVEICNASNLQSLLLDGLSTSSACLEEIFPNSPYFHTFKVKPNNVEGTIPPCIFNLPSLQTLHLAGNAFSGSLPHRVTLSPSLVNFSVAHNSLVNDIPVDFQARSWLNYDMSYNRFRGYLSSNIPAPDVNASYRTEVNRLSGSIPRSLIFAQDISILSGNNFACNTLRDDLPVNDPKYGSYDCGSTPVYRTMFFWVVIMVSAGFIYVTFVVATRVYDTGSTPSALHHTLVKLDGWLEQMDLPTGLDTGGLRSAKNLFRTIKRLFVTITAISVVLLMPVNAGLSSTYSTQDQSYVWVTSSIFLSGWVPAFTMVIGFSIVLITVWLFLSFRRDEVERTMLESERNTGFYIVFTLLNIMVMGTADVAYVVGISTYGGIAGLSIILGISIFKLGWNEGFLMSMFLPMKSYFYFYLCNETYNLQVKDKEEYKQRLNNVTFGMARGNKNNTGANTEEYKQDSTFADSIFRDSELETSFDYGTEDTNNASDFTGMPAMTMKHRSESSSIISIDKISQLKRKKQVISFFVSDLESQKRSEKNAQKQHQFINNPLHNQNIKHDDDSSSQMAQIRESGLGDSLATAYTVKDEDLYRDTRRKQRSYNLKTDVILNSHDIAVMTFNLIVNTVLLPGVSVMFANPNCFYHIFYPSETIPGAYSFTHCGEYDQSAWYNWMVYNVTEGVLSAFNTSETMSNRCVNALMGQTSVTYTAPFTYNYTCASNIITVYTEAFLYQTIAISLIGPTSKFIFKALNSYLTTNGADNLCCFNDDRNKFSWKEFFCCCYWMWCAALKSATQAVLPRNLWSLQAEPPHDEFVLFDQTFIPRMYSMFSILLVYGVIFPPLAIATCIAALVVTYSEEIIISRLIAKAKMARLSWVILRLSEECQGLEHRFTHPTLIWLVMLSVCPVYTYLVFDTASDPYGWQIGLIPAVFMFVVPTVFYLLRQGRKCMDKTSDSRGLSKVLQAVTDNTNVFRGASEGNGKDSHATLEMLDFRPDIVPEYTGRSRGVYVGDLETEGANNLNTNKCDRKESDVHTVDCDHNSNVDCKNEQDDAELTRRSSGFALSMTLRDSSMFVNRPTENSPSVLGTQT